MEAQGRVLTETTAAPSEVLHHRKRLAGLCRGVGAEIGPLHAPTQGLSPDSSVIYIDRESRADLLIRYRDDAGVRHDLIPDIEVVGDGAFLPFADKSLDFLISNHVIEHLANPLLALENWHRVLKPQGRLFLTVPDKRYCFDAPRELTSWDHLLSDYQRSDDGLTPESLEHWREWVRLIESVDEEGVEERVSDFIARRGDYHYHTWTYESLLATLDHAGRELGLAFDCDGYFSSYETWGEIIMVLTRSRRSRPMLARPFRLVEWNFTEKDEFLAELVEGHVWQQSFTCVRPHLTAIHVRFACYGRSNTGPLIFRLYEGDATKPLVEETVFIPELADNLFQTFNFPPLPGSAGREFRFTLEAPQSAPGNAIAVWCERNPPEGLVIRVDGNLVEGLVMNFKAMSLGLLPDKDAWSGETPEPQAPAPRRWSLRRLLNRQDGLAGQ